MNKTIIIGAMAALTSAGLIGCATTMSEAELGKRAAEVLRTSFASKGMVSIERLNQDEVQALCSEYGDQKPPKEIAEKIEKAQLATVRKPASGNLIGDWKAGEKIAQEGRGFQFSDTADGPKGANCYACHQLAPQEISFGNIGPSLYNYGKLRGTQPEVVEYTYNKIYNSNAYAACSTMPRFGHQKILTPEQIADVMALLLDPKSPVNN